MTSDPKDVYYVLLMRIASCIGTYILRFYFGKTNDKTRVRVCVCVSVYMIVERG